MKIVHRYSYIALLLPLHVGVLAGIGDHENRLDEDRVFLGTEELIEHENKELRNSQNEAGVGRSLLRIRNIRKPPADSPHTQDICSMPKEVGPCKALLPRFYYNKKKEQCEEFNYGGCFGNGNNFNTLAKCQKACDNGDNEGKRCPKKRPNPNDACDSQIVGEERCCYGKESCCGKTYDSFCCHCFSHDHWACYHTDACFAPCPCSDDVKKCPDGSFVGRDRFNDCKFSECPPFGVDDVCSLPLAIGPCEAAFTRYYYNSKTGQCEEFIYGGCEGNENNFEKMRQCQKACYDD